MGFVKRAYADAACVPVVAGAHPNRLARRRPNATWLSLVSTAALLAASLAASFGTVSTSAMGSVKPAKTGLLDCNADGSIEFS